MRIKLAFMLLFAASAWGQTALMPMPRQCFLDSLSAGRPLAGGKIFSYQSGTSTPQATFTDSTGLTQNTNPVILDAAGCSSIWLTAGLAYRFVAQNSFGVQEWLTDSVSGLQTSASTFASAYTTVTYSTTPTFTATGQFQVFKITLAGNVTSSSLSMGGVTVPSLVTFQITQDSAGGRTFVWPLNVASTAGPLPPLNLAANSTTTQSLFWDGTTAWALSNAFQPGPNVINASAYASLNAALSACGSSGTVQVTATVQLTASTTANCVLSVSKGATINLASGQSLNAAAGIEAGAYQIFTGTGTVANLTKAYPEWWGNTATCTTGACPLISNAVSALSSSGGTVTVGIGRYLSGFNAVNITTPSVVINGTRMPQWNASYSDYISGSGTIIEGSMSEVADNFTMRNVGINTGSVYINALNSGIALNAFVTGNTNQTIGLPPTKNLVLENASCLGFSAAAAFHCFLIENVRGARATNLQAAFNTHGVVLKGDHSEINGIYSLGHNTDDFIIKSDDYAPTSNDIISNIRCDVINVGDTAACVIINPQAAAMSNVTITGVTSGGTGGSGDGFNLNLNFASDHISISNVALKGGTKQSVCFHVQGPVAGSAYTLSGLTCDNYNYLVFMSQHLDGSTFSGLTGTNIGTGGNVGLLLEGIGLTVTGVTNSGTFTTGFTSDCASCTVLLNNWTLPGFSGTNYSQSGGAIIYPGTSNFYTISPNGFYGGGQTVTINSSTTTNVGMSDGAAQALLLRDNTNGGTAIIVNDANGGPAIIGAIGTTAFVTGAPGATQIQVSNVAGQVKLLGGASRNNAVVAWAEIGN